MMLTEFRTLSSAEIGGDLNTSGRILSGGADLSSLFVGVSTLSAQDIAYDNTKIQNGVGLDAATVQDALDELEIEKLNIRDAGTNIILFPTTTASDVSGYNVMVTSTIDPAFNLSAVDVSTPPVTSDTVPTIVGQLITAPGIIIGTPGLVNITTIGNIRKVSGNRNAVFYFEVYKREDDGNEIFLCASDPTPAVDTPNYRQFAESALLPITASFIETDRIVIKYLGLKTQSGGGDPVYQFQFGGSDPVRTLLPVPASVTIQETWRKNGDDIFYNLGNVGIGTDTPSARLSLSDDTLAVGGSSDGSILNLQQTWNTSGTPTAIRLDVTDTASNANSLLMDLRRSGESRFSVSRIGVLSLNRLTTSITGAGSSALLLQEHTNIRWLGGGQQWIRSFSGRIMFGSGASGSGTEWGRWTGGNLKATGAILIGSRTGGGADTGAVGLRSGGNDTLEQRDSTNPQEFRLYNTYTNASNFERLSLKANTGGAFEISSVAGGTGVLRDIALMGGNVGIKNNEPKYTLDVNGTVHPYSLLTDYFGGGFVEVGGERFAGALSLPSNSTVTMGDIDSPWILAGRYRNYLRYSEEFQRSAAADWVQFDVEVTANTHVSPRDTSVTADLIVGQNSGAKLVQTVATGITGVDSIGDWNFSVYLRSPDNNNRIVGLKINSTDNAGNIVEEGSVKWVTVNEAWQRFAVTQEFTDTDHTRKSVEIIVDEQSVVAWGAQLDRSKYARRYSGARTTSILSSLTTGINLLGGNVGIGTTTPETSLHITGTSGITMGRNSAQDATCRIFANSSDELVISSDTSKGKAVSINGLRFRPTGLLWQFSNATGTKLDFQFSPAGWSNNNTETPSAASFTGTFGSSISTNNWDFFIVSPTVNVSGTASFVDFLINRKGNVSSSGYQHLFAARVNGNHRLFINTNGDLSLTGDIEAETIGNGVILKSPNGTRYRITIDNNGALISTALP